MRFSITSLQAPSTSTLLKGLPTSATSLRAAAAPLIGTAIQGYNILREQMWNYPSDRMGSGGY